MSSICSLEMNNRNIDFINQIINMYTTWSVTVECGCIFIAQWMYKWVCLRHPVLNNHAFIIRAWALIMKLHSGVLHGFLLHGTAHNVIVGWAVGQYIDDYKHIVWIVEQGRQHKDISNWVYTIQSCIHAIPISKHAPTWSVFWPSCCFDNVEMVAKNLNWY